MKKVAFLSLSAILFLTLSFIPKAKKTVIIDVAHGGNDLGSIHKNLAEKDVVLSIAQKIQELNVEGKLNIILTRETDDFIQLKDRVNTSETVTPALFISLHANYSQKESVNGLELYTKANDLQEESRLLAENIKNAYPSQIAFKSINDANFFVLKNSDCPSALIELGFLSNDKDREYLLSEEGQWEIARAIYNSIK